MVYPGHTYIAGRQKPLSILAAAFLLSLPIINTRIAEAVLSFCFGGIVPGTNIILSPDTVIWSTVGLFVGSIIVISLVKARRSRRERMHQPIRTVISVPVIEDIADVVHDVPLQSANEVFEPIQTIDRTQLKSHRLRIIRMSLWRGLLDSLTALVVISGKLAGKVSVYSRQVTVVVTAGIRRMSLFVYRSVCTGVLFIYHAARIVLKGIVIATRQTIRFSITALSRLWAWAKPKLRYFDAWLEVRVRRLEAVLRRISHRNDVLSTLKIVLREYLRSPIHRSPKQPAAPEVVDSTPHQS